MKILNICTNDWANFAYDNMKALRSVGLDCDSIKRNSHSFYNEQSEIIPELADICERISQYDVIQFFHDDLSFYLRIRPAMKGKKIIVYHTSSEYRRNYTSINKEMNMDAYRSVCAMPEFIGKGAKNEVYMVGAVDTEKLKPCETIADIKANASGNFNDPNIWNRKRELTKPFKFAHYPSNPKVKGTGKVVQMMSVVGENFKYSTELVGYEEQLKRISECDVYVEMYSNKDGNGQPYGNFGITALEAAAMGKVVLTQCRNSDVYFNAYGSPKMAIAKNENGFILRVIGLKEMTVAQLANFQKLSREHIEQCHSYKATGEYFLKNVL